MYRIVKKEALKPTVTLYEIEAPMVAKKAEPGQFIILRVDENGERIPITIHDFDREKGTVTIIVQTIGATTEKLRHKAEGEYIQDFVGPLGRPTETEGKKKVCVVGGGVGGGGQPIHDGEERAFERGKNLYYLDRNANLRFSHENPDVIQMYKEYFEAPMSHKAHMLLHTEHKKNM